MKKCVRADVRFAPRTGVRACDFFAHIKQIHMKTNTQIAITTATTTHKKRQTLKFIMRIYPKCSVIKK